jgi:hypothetical protein
LVSDYSSDSLHPFIAANLAPGATAKTDGWSAYPGAPSVKHDPHVVGKMAAHIVVPWVHRIFGRPLFYDLLRSSRKPAYVAFDT